MHIRHGPTLPLGKSLSEQGQNKSGHSPGGHGTFDNTVYTVCPEVKKRLRYFDFCTQPKTKQNTVQSGL